MPKKKLRNVKNTDKPIKTPKQAKKDLKKAKKLEKRSSKAKKQTQETKKQVVRGPIKAKEQRKPEGLSYDDLVNLESWYGGMLFGPIPAGHQREFFEHKKNVWIWYEGWTDALGIKQEITIRYEVRPSGVYKGVAGKSYEKIGGAELDNFREAARSYLKFMKTQLYYQ